MFNKLCKLISLVNVPSQYAFYNITVYGKNPHLFSLAGKYDLGIFLLTNSSAVHLFHQYKINLIISSSRK